MAADVYKRRLQFRARCMIAAGCCSIFELGVGQRPHDKSKRVHAEHARPSGRRPRRPGVRGVCEEFAWYLACHDDGPIVTGSAQQALLKSLGWEQWNDRHCL